MTSRSSSASAAAPAIEFDLACWFTGDAAVAAAAEDGEESPPPNNYYVRNVNPLLRTVAVAEIPEVTWLPNVGDPATEESIAYADWLVQREGRGLELQPGVWLIVENGEITAPIREGNLIGNGPKVLQDIDENQRRGREQQATGHHGARSDLRHRNLDQEK